MRHRITQEIFQQNSENVLTFREFLHSPVGQAVIAVLENSHPIRHLGKPSLSKGGNNIRAAAAAESDGNGGGRSENILGRVEGYETALELIHDLSELPKQQKKRSKKTGGDPKPASLPTT